MHPRLIAAALLRLPRARFLPRVLAAAAIALLALVVAGDTRAAHAQGLQFSHLRPDDGLAGSWVQDIIQDSRGFMWFGTSNGLNRYDGYRMELFRNEFENARSLSNSSVRAIYEDRAGVLWAGTSYGLSRFDRARNDFDNYMVQGASNGVVPRVVYDLLEDSRGTFWVATSDGLFTFDRAKRVATEYRMPKPKTGDRQVVNKLFEDRRRHVLIGTFASGLFDLDPATGVLRQHGPDQGGAQSFPGANIYDFVEDGQGRLWVGTYETGLVQLDLDSGIERVHRHDPANPSSLSTDRVRRIALDKDGMFWVGTENGGLDHFDPATGISRHNRANPGDPFGLSSSSLWSLFVDTSGTLWAGSFSGGIDILRPGSAAIRQFSNIGGDTTSLSHDAVTSFAQDSTGTVWVGTDGGGLNRLDAKSGRFTRITTTSSALNHNAVLAIAAEPSGVLWLGTWEGGLTRFDPRTRRFTAYTTKNSDIPDDHIFAVHRDRRGRIWVGTWQQGLALFDPATGSFTHYRLELPGKESQIWLLRELRDGRILAATPQNGMYLFDPETKSVTTYRSDARSPASLSSSDVRAAVEVEPGVLWIGTGAGLDRLDLRTNAIMHYRQADGLPSSAIAGIAADDAGRIWVSTDRGIARFDPATRSAWRFTVADGLQSREFVPRAFLHLRDGSMLFGGNHGFNLIQPGLLKRNESPPRVALTGFQLFNAPVEIGTPGSPLRSHIAETKRIVLGPSQSVFTFEFAALDYLAPSKNQYAYKLEGFDENWRRVGATRTATYTSLAPGTYVFHVKASNNDGVWNKTGAAIEVVIAPPLWKTWWFRTLVGLLLLSAVLLVIRNAHKRHQRLQALNQQLGKAAEHDRESQQYLERNVLDILGAMQKFSGGDYSVALAVQSEDAIGKLRLGFNSVVADRKRAEEELRQSQKMEAVGRLAGGVAHDFNNLLTVIKGNAELALADLDSKDAVREELEEVERAAERASSLTRQLLAFSRKQILKPQRLALNDLVADLARMLRRTVGEDIELKIVLDPTLGAVRADPGQIEQVLLNLVVNARDAMPRGGELRIETRNVLPAELRHHGEAEDVAYVALIVADTGTGMPEDVRERVFEPFFTTKEQGKGTGLGLSTVYGSVKQSGGYVVVESVVGAGSTFAIYLPRVDAMDETRSTGEMEAIPRGSATVLLVEDEDAVRRLGSRVLLRSGYTVLTASCGDEALEVAANHVGTIDLLMTDVVMPGMSGRELAERLLPLRPGMRLMYASGYTEDAIIRHGVSSQQTAFLEKPFTPNGLLRKVREVLEAPATDSATVQLAS